MVAGLLHDLGKVILSHLALEDYLEVIRVAHERGCHVAEVEREVFGVDHTRIALWLALHWHLPDSLTDALTCHHAPSRAKCDPKMTAIVHLADILARAQEYGEPGDGTLPALDHEAFDSLGLDDEQLERIMVEADERYREGAEVMTAGIRS